MSVAEEKVSGGGQKQYLEPEKSFAGSAPVPLKIMWLNVVVASIGHLIALYGIYTAFASASFYTVLFNVVLYIYAGLGITAGAHRLWSHRSYKATGPLRVFLVIGNTLAFQATVLEWARDHRGHHKWSETSADPHDTNRGPFFAHMGWLLVKKHPDVIKKGKTLDLDDLINDPVLDWQKRNYLSLVFLIVFFFPTIIPHMLWGETLVNAYFVAMARYILMLHATWCVNSIAHMFGTKPYDPTISPVQSPITSVVALGEGWHNYHHSFPQDYKTAELPYTINFTTIFIDACAFLGLAYDLKSTNQETIDKKKENAKSMVKRHQRQRSTG